MGFSPAILLLLATTVLGQLTGNHPDWPRWCGKVYEPGYPSFDPGGQTLPPGPASDGPLLFIELKSRYSIYLASDTEGQFIVNAPYSQYYGVPWPNSTSRSNRFVFSINLVSDDTPLVENSVAVNSTNNVFSFSFTHLTPRIEPYKVVIYGAPEGGEPTESATTDVYYLPEKSNGSVTKIDNLSGGMYFRNAASNNIFEPLLAYGFYASYDGFLGEANNTAEIQKYADYGLNGMTPLTTYPDPLSVAAFNYLDKIDLKWQYDLRDDYMNLTWVEEKVNLAKDAEAIFSYWLADEPDGWQYPFNGTVLGNQLIKKLDPYHPVAVVLNCQDYYFKEYSASVDIIMEDVYPIGINSTWSKWGTACNTTLGDCGCDNCEGNVQDVANRLEDLTKYEDWLGLWHKTKIHNPQSFHGEDYWFRDPSVEEEWVMSTLAFNHGAQSIISWVYPDSEILSVAHGTLAKVVTRSPVVDFIVGARPVKVKVPCYDVVDVSYWTIGKQVLVSVANGGYVDIGKPVSFAVPGAVTISSTPWGNVSWDLAGSRLSAPSLPALGTSMVVLDLL